MPFATLDRLKINYLAQGAGPHLLMCAPGGFDATIARWSAGGVWKEMDAINALSRHFTVIAYDRRESGSSGGRVERLTWQTYAREAKLLLDHLRIEQAYLVGACMGASVALAVAARYPAMCRALLLHWPVGGYRWMQKGGGVFNRHMDFVRAHGLAAVAARAAAEKKNFWLDPESGPWASVIAADAEFAGQYAKQEVRQYLRIVAASRDALFRSTMPSGATGEELTAMNLRALILPGADPSHATSAAWALRELMPMAELWEVLPPHQNGRNVLERMLEFRRAVEQAASAQVNP